MTAPYRSALPFATAALTPPHPLADILESATLRVDMTRGARLLAVWSSHPPAHLMLAVKHYLAMLVHLRSESAGWHMVADSGSVRGNLPMVCVEVLVDDDDYLAKRAAERMLDAVLAELNPSESSRTAAPSPRSDGLQLAEQGRGAPLAQAVC